MSRCDVSLKDAMNCYNNMLKRIDSVEEKNNETFCTEPTLNINLCGDLMEAADNILDTEKMLIGAGSMVEGFIEHSNAFYKYLEDDNKKDSNLIPLIIVDEENEDMENLKSMVHIIYKKDLYRYNNFLKAISKTIILMEEFMNESEYESEEYKAHFHEICNLFSRNEGVTLIEE